MNVLNIKNTVCLFLLILFLCPFSASAGLRIDKTQERYKEFMPEIDFSEYSSASRFEHVVGQGREYESAKIDFLLEATLKSNFEFDRNRMRHDASETVRHLRKKYRNNFREIKTAEDFIHKIATRSEASGRRYLAIPGNGYVYYTSDLLLYQLEQLEAILNEKYKSE
jgi:hypothetical protein